WTDHYADIMGDKEGNFSKGIEGNRTLPLLITKTASLPKLLQASKEKEFDKEPTTAFANRQNLAKTNIKNAVQGMGRELFSQYMDIMDGCLDEMDAEYHRQQMEKSGWNENSERSYKNELMYSHEKIIDAFDAICAVDDNHQYDNYLNNNLDNITGSHGIYDRDMAAEVGYLKGEKRAIEMGYPSDELNGLGIYGQIQACLDREARQLDHRTKLANKELNEASDDKAREKAQKSIQGIEKDRESHNKKQQGFSGLRDQVWDKEYSGPEATLDAYKKADDFIAENGISSGDHTYRAAKYQIVNKLADKTTDMKELSDALGEFNTKRSGIFSKESKSHEALRKQAEELQKDLRAYKTGIYQDGPDKGKRMSAEDKERLAETIQADATLMERAANNYLDEHKKDRSTGAGRSRKDGAEKLGRFAASIKDRFEKQLEAGEKKAGVDSGLNQQIQEGMEPQKRTESTRRLDEYADKLQDKMEKKFKDGYDTYEPDQFKHDVAEKVVIHTLRQRAK
ncbi:MAG: hypothetical protein J6N76_04935, partial [Lachnospiraceae bacterium]|nr:hypothetical protein [Lachnospiraceae bacterium]